MVIKYLNSNENLTILSLRENWPEEFYRQDWYDNEEFANRRLEIGHHTFDTYGKGNSPPTAIACTYLYIVQLMLTGAKLWPKQYIWCSDTDNEGNRIYVGGWDKGHDKGFQIHRHLVNPTVSTINYRLD